MPDKPSAPIFNELFGDVLRPAPQAEPPPLVAQESHAKLARNLSKALDRHNELMDLDIGPDAPANNKRVVLDAASTTIKAATTVDRTALKARSENVHEITMLRIWFAGVKLGRDLKPEDYEKLRTAPRAKVEAAIGARQMAKYDAINWDDLRENAMK